MPHSSNRPTRRSFLKTAAAVTGAGAAAVAAPMIVPASALGAAGSTAASERVTLGFIGTGKQAQHHLNALGGRLDCQILAVCDVDKTRREHSQKVVVDKYKKLERTWKESIDIYDDFREITSRKDIDAVVISTPDHWHAIPILEACKAKKDIYCEKPLTLTIHEAKLVVDAVRKHKVVFQTGSQQRSDHNFLKACEYVRNGRIGKIKEVIVDVGGPSKWCDLPQEEMEPGLDWDTWLGPAPKRPYNSVLSPRGMHNHYPNWRNYREYSGGMMTDWGAHHFDITQWGLGMDEAGPDEIIPPEDKNAQRGVRYIYKNTPVGKNVTVIHGKSGGVLFKGEDGEIFCNRGRTNAKPEDIYKDPLGDDAIRLYKSPGHHEDWLRCIKSRERPICDVEIGARSVTVCHLGNLAYWNDKTIKWDPKKWRFTDDTPAAWLDRERRDPWQLPKV